MKVPIAEEHVSAQGPQVPEPQVAAPIEGAYGVNVAQANAGIGKSVSDIGSVLAKHAEQQMLWQAQADGYNALSAYKTQLQAHEHSDGETKTVLDSTGNKVQIPLGYYDRRGIAATLGGGVVQDFDKDASKAKEAILKSLSPVAQAHFLRSADYYTEGYRQRAITYQAKQHDTYVVGSMDNQIKSKIEEAQSAMTPESLKSLIDGDPSRGVDGIISINQKLGGFRQEPPETTSVNEQKHISDAVTASAISTLRNTHDLEMAQGQVDAFASRMNPGDSAKLSETLDRMKRGIDSVAEYHAKLDQEKTDSDFVTRAVSDDPTEQPTRAELDKAMMLGAVNKPGGISEKVYNAIIKTSKEGPISQEEKDQMVSDLADAQTKILDNEGKNIDPKAHLEDIADYKAKLLEASAAKALPGKAFFTKKIGFINKAYSNGLDQEVNAAYGTTPTVWKFLKNSLTFLFPPAAGLMGKEAKPDQVEMLRAKAFLGRAFMDRVAEGGIPEGKAHEVAQQILGSYIASRHPDVLGAKAVPNNKSSKNEGIMPLHTMRVESHSDRKITAPKTVPSKQITPANLAHTAKLHGLTVEEVKKKLGIDDGDGPSRTD